MVKVKSNLSKVFGIGKCLSKQILNLLGVNENIYSNKLTESQNTQISAILNQNYFVGVELKKNTKKNIERLIKIKSYKGFRHVQGLPTRGQRTHTNAVTAGRLKKNYRKI